MPGRMIIPFGPQHPVLPEPIQLKLVLEDEKVVDVLPAIGYVHRGLEKLTEAKDYVTNVMVVERVCGICSFMHALCYSLAIEELMKVEVPPRASYLRVIWGELHRMHSLLLWLGLQADALGFESLFMHSWRIREKIVDLMDLTAGSRVMISACVIGGTRRDIPADLLAHVDQTVRDCEREIDAIAPTFLNDRSIKHRTVGVGVLTKDQAYLLGAAGPMLRASGIKQDLRTTGYAAYGELDFEPVVETAGDSYARMVVRIKELYTAMDLIHQAIARIPDGPFAVPVKGNPNGETVARVEQPRGECLYYVKANGTPKLDRLRIRTPTFANFPALISMVKGSNLADVPILVLSIDPCISCTER